MTPYATGATIKDIVNEALIMAIRDGRDVITWKDVTRAKHLKDLGPPEDVEYIERERHAIAVHEASHAIVAYKTRKHYEIDLATIEKGGTYLGMVSSVKPEDQFTSWKSEMESDIMVSLASLAGERMFFEGDNSSGVAGDLEHATSTASNMEARWGMGQNVAMIITPDWHTQQMGKSGEDLAVNRGRIAERVEGNLVILLEQARAILVEHRRDVLCLAHALESSKTLTGDDVKAVFERRPGHAHRRSAVRGRRLLPGDRGVSPSRGHRSHEPHRDPAHDAGAAERRGPGLGRPTGPASRTRDRCDPAHPARTAARRPRRPRPRRCAELDGARFARACPGARRLWRLASLATAGSLALAPRRSLACRSLLRRSTPRSRRRRPGAGWLGSRP